MFNYHRVENLDAKRYSRRRCLFFAFPGVEVRDPSMSPGDDILAKLGVVRDKTGVIFTNEQVEDAHLSSDRRFLLIKVIDFHGFDAWSLVRRTSS